MSRKMEYTGRYSLSRFEYGYAKWYSLRYNDWLEEYNSLKDSLNGSGFTESVQGGKGSNPTERLATRRKELRDKMLKIENAAFDASDELAEYILIAVTNEDVTFDVLKAKYNIPCERTYYYDKRRKYYWLLAKEI